jgi:amino acid adenylation domain-containing protein
MERSAKGRARTIPRLERENGLGAISYNQERLWFLDQLEHASPLYNMAAAVRLTGSLNIAALEQSLDEIVLRHEVLRTSFDNIEGRPVAVIAPKSSLKLQFVDLAELPAAERSDAADRLCAEAGRRPFDLDRPPLLRASLFHLDDLENLALTAMHHIISDAWSLGVFIEEMGRIYESYAIGRSLPLPELPIQFADFADWQRKWLEGDTLQRQLDYWTERLGPNPTVLQLPTDHPRPAIQSYRGATRTITMPPDRLQELKGLSFREGSTLFMTLMAAYSALLYRYSHQDRINIGTPISGRRYAETEGLIGFFVNTLVLGAVLFGEMTLRDVLKGVSEATLGAEANQEVPFEKLVDALQVERSASHNPLFQVWFVLQNAPLPRLQLARLTLEPLPLSLGIAKFDLTLSMTERGQGLIEAVEYNADLFDVETIDRFMGHYNRILEAIVADPDVRLCEADILSQDETRQILIEWNPAAAESVREGSIQQLFEGRVNSSPDAIALLFQEEQVSYFELNERANRLAHYLKSLGAAPETLVGVCLPRSPDAVIALVGILKAGATYLPLDPEHPEDRLAFMILDSQVSVVITLQWLISSLPPEVAATEVVCLDTDWAEISRSANSNPTALNTPDQLAYVIYTSGSTGMPKGVGISHGAAISHFDAIERTFELSGGDRILEFASLSFDVSLEQILPTILCGATLMLRAPEAWTVEEFWGEVARRGLTVVNPPTAYWHSLARGSMDRVDLEGTRQLRLIISGGDMMQPEAIRQWQLTGLQSKRLLNAYGPTEATITSTVYEVGSDLAEWGESRRVPIGKAVGSRSLFLLGRAAELVPVGVPGELHVGGTMLARGYLGRTAETAEKFIPDAYGKTRGGRLYRTGDLCRFLTDGNVEFIGRTDDQVKVRGFRIELGEIEAVLSQHPDVKDVVVLASREKSGEKRLIGYAVPRDDASPSASELQKYSKERLPQYMVPSVFVFLDELPLTPNGKIDRQSLPAPDFLLEAEDSFLAPRSPVEEGLAALWIELLDVPRVGVHDNFFGIGGHSLLATQLVSRVRDVFQVEIPLRTIFESPTVEQLASVIETTITAQSGLMAPGINRLKRTADPQRFPLSYAQQRLWLLDQLEPESALYNIPCAVRLTGLLDVGTLRQSLNEILRRHEVLRTRFLAFDGNPVQEIGASNDLELALVDLAEVEPEQLYEEAAQLARQEIGLPFSLDRSPLIRTRLLRLGDTRHILLVTIHHIVSDGWSIQIMVRELTQLYEAFRAASPSSLGELEIQYGDFAVWQREWLQREELRAQLDYWKRNLEGVPILELPADRQRPSYASFRGTTESFGLSAELTEALNALSRRQGVTLFMTLLVGFQILLSRYTGQRDIAIGSPIAGRNREETERLIGFFVNTVVMRANVGGNQTVRECLEVARETALGAYANQDLPFEKLVEELQPQRSLSYQALFQVWFAMQNAPKAAMKLADLELRPEPMATGVSKFDLTLSFIEEGDRLLGRLEYATDLFDRVRIQRMIGHACRLLQGMAANADAMLMDLPMLTEMEAEQVILEWNDTAAPIVRKKCLQQMFEEQVERTPERVAIAHDGEALTYADLNKRANQLARYLRQRGTGPEVRVGICTARCPAMVVGILGTLKAGGTYVPIDPNYPTDRVGYLLEDSGAKLILTSNQIGKATHQWSSEAIDLHDDWAQIGLESASKLQPTTSADNLAYVIYTSGSTGKPKGVCLQHEGTAAFLNSAHTVFAEDRLRGVLASSSICFDLSIFDIFLPLCFGGRMVLVDNALALSGMGDQELISMLLTVPSVMQSLLKSDSLPSWIETVNLCGEPLPWEVVDGLYSSCAVGEVYNQYGPTETTTYSTLSLVGADPDTLSIGRPIADTSIYIFDERFQPVPVGVAGEIHIGGVGLARGYHERPDLTAEKFIANPFGDLPGQRVYRTGDVGRYRRDGTIECMGRVDHQIKIRGYRVELGEIESVLTGHQAVAQCAAIVREDPGADKRLVAYVVPTGENQLDVAELRRYLQQRLPDYMIPSAFVEMSRFPSTLNGKLDRKALPALSMTADDNKGLLTPTEEVLAGIWAGVLGIERVGAHQNFFELGGHSLLAAQVVSRARSVLGLEIPLRSLFANPTVAELARDITTRQREGRLASAPKLERAGRAGPFQLSFAQQRLWFIEQLGRGGAAYNISFAMRLRGNLDVEALRRSLSEMIRRHEVLRTAFPSQDGRPVPIISAAAEADLVSIDLTDTQQGVRELRATELAQQEAAQTFDLARGPLIRTKLLKLRDTDHVLVVTMHHIVSDAWTIAILAKELPLLYEAFRTSRPSPLAELEIQYVDYADWQRQWLSGEVLEGYVGHWTQRLAGYPSVLELPADLPRPPIQNFEGAQLSFTLSKELTDSVKALCAKQGVTLFMSLLGAFYVLLKYYTGRDDLAVGVDVANRNSAETEALMGLFVNQLVLRTGLDGNPSFQEVLSRVRETALGSYAYQHLPFDKLVEALNPHRDLSRNPLFQVMFGFQNIPFSIIELPELVLSQMELPVTKSVFDLTLYMADTERGLSGVLRYRTDLFQPATISRMASHFETVVSCVTAQPDMAIDAVLQVLASADEHERLQQERELELLTLSKLGTTKRRGVAP